MLFTREVSRVLEVLDVCQSRPCAMVWSHVETPVMRTQHGVQGGHVLRGWPSVLTTSSAFLTETCVTRHFGDTDTSEGAIVLAGLCHVSMVSPTPYNLAIGQYQYHIICSICNLLCSVGINCTDADYWQCGQSDSDECISRYFVCDGVADCEVVGWE